LAFAIELGAKKRDDNAGDFYSHDTFLFADKQATNARKDRFRPAIREMVKDTDFCHFGIL